EKEALEMELVDSNRRIHEVSEALQRLQSEVEKREADFAEMAMLREAEEEKEQVVRERQQTQTRVAREFEERLRTVERGSEGTRGRAKELQELLREKQQELSQFQRDCIKYQQRITGLEKTVKALEVVRNDVQNELSAARFRLSGAAEEKARLEAELSECKINLDDTQSEVARVLAENDRVKEEMQKKEEQLKTQLKRREEEVERKLAAEREKQRKDLQNLHEQMEMAEDELKQLKDRSDNLAEISENAKKTMDELRASQELLQEDVHQKEKELQRLMLACDELQTDVQNQRQLTEQLEGVIASKEEAISRLLVTKESEELRHQADKLEAANEEKLKAERELQKMADRLTSMEAKVKKAYEDKIYCKLWELRGLREQYVRIGEESGDIPHLRAEMHDLKQQAMAQQALQGAHREEMSILQVQVSHMRSDNEALLAENQAMKEQFLATLADRDSRIAELQRFCQELRSQSEHSKITSMTCKSWGSPHQTAADGGDGSTPEEVLRLQSELQRCLQELHQKELRLQQLNNKLLVAVEERNVLTGQLKSRSLSLRDAQQRLSDVQGRYRGLESECQALRHSLHHGDNVPPGAPQERASARLEVDPAEVAELQRRLTETEQLHDTSHQERSRLEETLNEERERRVAAEEALLELEEKMNRYGWRSVNTPLQFPCNIRPRVSSPQMRGGGWWCRRWLGGRAAYCSRLLRSRPLARVALLCYLLVLHAAVLMCYLGLL
uniref:Uncharacterized protein n=1 Tax=Petromyzon marinus TaxID=7757 RepID=S4RLC6_PETMA